MEVKKIVLHNYNDEPVEFDCPVADNIVYNYLIISGDEVVYAYTRDGAVIDVFDSGVNTNRLHDFYDGLHFCPNFDVLQAYIS